MTRWDVVWGGGVMAVLAVLCIQVVRSVREVLAVERRRVARSDRRVAGPSLAAIPVVDGQGLTTPLAVLSLDGGDLADDPQVTPVPNDAAARVVAELEGRR